MNTIMQYTNLGESLGDFSVYDDLTVTKNGLPSPESVVTMVDGTPRLECSGNGAATTNQVPPLGDVMVTRVPGWQGALGWRVVLLDWETGATPNAVGLGVYSAPNATNYLFTTGGFIWDAALQEWYVTCPPGQEPAAGANIYFGFLYGSSIVSSFTMFNQWTEQNFRGGGAWQGTYVTLQKVGANVNGVPDATYSPDGHLIVSAGTFSASKLFIELAANARDAKDPVLTIYLPTSKEVIGFVWQENTDRYESGAESGIRLKLMPWKDTPVRVTLIWR